jgi:hypothetical protein
VSRASSSAPNAPVRKPGEQVLHVGTGQVDVYPDGLVHEEIFGLPSSDLITSQLLEKGARGTPVDAVGGDGVVECSARQIGFQ